MYDTARIESLEAQVRTLKRMLFGVFGLVLVGGLLAAGTATSSYAQDKPMKVELVSPIKISDCVYVQSGKGASRSGTSYPFIIKEK